MNDWRIRVEEKREDVKVWRRVGEEKEKKMRGMK